MQTYIALFRGINVGGHNKLLMKDLRSLMKNLGYRDVDTYIQTGNVVFRTEKSGREEIAERISSAVEHDHGFKPAVMLLEPKELKEAMAANPFPAADENPKTLHLMFLASIPPDPDFESLDEIKKESENYELKEKVFYLYAPEGIGRSKLAGKIDRALGVTMTGRNWRTVKKISEMLDNRE